MTKETTKTTTAKKPGRKPNPASVLMDRTSPEYVEVLQNIAFDHWLEEVSLLELLYDHEDVFTEEKEFWKEIKYRNSALMSQLNHCKMLAQFCGKAVHARGKNTTEEKQVSEVLLDEVRAKLKPKIKAHEKRRGDFLEKKFGNRGESGSIEKGNYSGVNSRKRT